MLWLSCSGRKLFLPAPPVAIKEAVGGKGCAIFVAGGHWMTVDQSYEQILALLDAATEGEVPYEAAHAALSIYHGEPADDIVWSDLRIDEMRAALAAALRVMRGQR